MYCILFYLVKVVNYTSIVKIVKIVKMQALLKQCLPHVQCPAKKFDYKLTKRTVTDLFFRLKYLMYSDQCLSL